MTQEEYWEFFADNMAPITSPQSVSLSSSGTAMQEDQAKEVVSSFFGALAICHWAKSTNFRNHTFG